MSSPPDESSTFSSTYRDHYDSLLKTAFLMTGSTAAAEDAVHEVFVRCADRLDKLDHPASYLRTAVVNECRTQHRRQSRSVEAGSEEANRRNPSP